MISDSEADCKLHNFLSERNFKIHVRYTLSKLQKKGVPQKCILSDILFSTKINNIFKYLNWKLIVLYVDVFICYRSKHIYTMKCQLQQCLNKMNKWATYVFKFSKTKICKFSPTKKNVQVKKQKYLQLTNT